MLIEKCPRCGESLASSTLGSTVVSCGRCSGAFVMSRYLAAAGLSDSSIGPDAAPLGAPPSIELPPHFRERYEIGAPLGRGTMGLVLRGRDLRDGRDIAIKILLSASDDNILARFLREAELLASVEHPHLVQVLDLDQLDGHPCLITELLGGGTLRDLITGPMDPREVVRIAVQCLGALDACHAAGIIHRDLKPENILFDTEGNAKVADLGIAKMYGEGDRLTRTGAFIGTPRYMSPEQARGLAATAATDVYGMGVLVYEMLAGVRPVDADGLRELIEAILIRPPPPLADKVAGLRPALIEAVERSLAKRPEDRFASAGEFALALRRGLDPMSGPIPRVRLSGSIDSERRRAAIRDSAQRAMASMQLAVPEGIRRPPTGSATATATDGQARPAGLTVPVAPASGGPSGVQAGAAASPTPGSAAAVSAPVPVPVNEAARAPGASSGRARAGAPSGPNNAPRTRASGAQRSPASRPSGRLDAPVTEQIDIGSGSGGSAGSSGSVSGWSGLSGLSGWRNWSARRRAVVPAAAVAMSVLVIALTSWWSTPLGDPRTVEVRPGINGVLVRWKSPAAYAAIVRAEEAARPPGSSAAGAAREEAAVLDHHLLVTGLKDGGTYRLALEDGRRAVFPPLIVKLGKSLELPGSVNLTPRGPDEMEARLDMSVPVSVVLASSAEPGLSVEASPDLTSAVRVRVRGPGAAAGLVEVQLRVQSVDGVTAERTLRVQGGAERLREYTASSRFVRDLEALDLDIRNRRIAAAEREKSAERQLRGMSALKQLVEDLPALEHALLSPVMSMGRRARLYEILCDLLVMERLLIARLVVKEPGASLPEDAVIRRLTDVRRITEQFLPMGARLPPGPLRNGDQLIYHSEYGKGGMVARGPGMEDARAGAQFVAGGLVDVVDVLTFRAQRRKLPRELERIRLTVRGRCLASHLVLVVRLNRTYRLRLFGSSEGVKPGDVSAVAFVTSEKETEQQVPREELWLDIPSAMLQDGENTFEITARTLVQEMGGNTVFCTPSVHDVHWGAAP